MKMLRYLYRTMPVLLISLFLSACEQEIMDIDKVQEQMELSASSTDLVLSEENLTEDVVTFTWTEARPQSDDHIVSYTTKLDVVGNNFGSSTAIMSYEDEGIYSRSFTSEQLQNWANEKWGVPANQPFTVEFRVVAQWEGGSTFEAPEVRTITIDVQPIRTVVFDADKVFIDGTAVPGMSSIEVNKTLENQSKYAYLLQLEAGELQIPVEFQGKTNYICPADGISELKDGEAVAVKMREKPVSWNIETPGEYRIVIDMQKATVAIHSPATALMPKSVVWNDSNGKATTTTITDLWMHGAINSWGTPIKMNCAVSLADPQVLVYTGARAGKAKFIVYGGSDNDKNLAYAFGCEPKSETEGQEQTLTLGKSAGLQGGSSRGQRNSYYTIPAGANIVVFDLRNMTILCEKR